MAMNNGLWSAYCLVPARYNLTQPRVKVTMFCELRTVQYLAPARCDRTYPQGECYYVLRSMDCVLPGPSQV
jgi:hypothetical protein